MSKAVVLDELWLNIKLLACPPAELLQQLVLIARNVRRVEVSDMRGALPDLPMVLHDAEMRCEVLAASHRLSFASDAT